MFSKTDEQLMQAWQEGDLVAFDALYQRLRGPLYRYILRQVQPAQAAEEIYQETWVTFIRQREHWTAKAALKSYLYRLAHSRVVDFFRARGRHEVFENEVTGDEPDEASSLACDLPTPEAALHRKNQAEALRLCLETLSPEQREAFLLSQEAELSRTEISSVTGVGEETVKTRIRYAFSKLRNCLAKVLEAA